MSRFARLVRACFTGLAAIATSGASAASLTVRVADQAAAPLADAVVYAIPTNPATIAGKAPVAVEIAQINRAFTPPVTVVQTGASISFPNRDTVRHQVYSFSPAKVFELRLYAGMPATPIVFDKPGLVVLGCNIHDRMVAYVMVVDTPWYGKSAADGVVHIDGLPAGTYKVTVWSSRAASAGPEKVVTVSGDTTIATAIELKPS